MAPEQLTSILGYAGIALLVLGVVAAITLAIIDKDGAPRRYYRRYVDTLEDLFKFLFIQQQATRVAAMQAAAIGVALTMAGLLQSPILLIVAAAAAVGPIFILRRRKGKRLTELETQLDGWLLLLANALKASPALGEAIGNSAKLTRPPISQELDIVLKEIQLGSSTEQAILEMSKRVDSRVLSTALATILVGRQTGGDLPAILEEGAATLREMARLEGVVRTKTAENKNQAIALAALPFALIGVTFLVDRTWLAPMVDEPIGWVLSVVAFFMWLGAIFWARSVLTVDI